MEGPEEIDFTRDRFEDVTGKDRRYDANSYAFLLAVLGNLDPDRRPFDIHDILDEFRLFAIDQYGSMARVVLEGWGLKGFEDVSEMVFNLVEAKRLDRDDFDIPESYGYEYDFKTAFDDPYSGEPD